jgi:hypothetical protein
MALIDRVKERIESDLLDDELQRLIDEANQEVLDRWGPHSQAGSPITVVVRGESRYVDLPRPLDTAQSVTVLERWDRWLEQTTTLAANDYRVLHDGHTLERLRTGTNPPKFGWARWGHRVDVTYVPRNDGNQREEVIVKLVQLAVEFQGVDRRRVGDTDQQSADYVEEREKLLESLAPRRGLLVR